MIMNPTLRSIRRRFSDRSVCTEATITGARVSLTLACTRPTRSPGATERHFCMAWSHSSVV